MLLLSKGTKEGFVCLDENVSHATPDEFPSQWCRLQKWRIDWERMLTPCVEKMSWDLRDVTSPDRTSASNSYIAKWFLSPAGKTAKRNRKKSVKLTEVFDVVEVNFHICQKPCWKWDWLLIVKYKWITKTFRKLYDVLMTPCYAFKCEKITYTYLAQISGQNNKRYLVKQR